MNEATSIGVESLAMLEQSVSLGPLGHLPVWQAVSAGHVEPGIRQLLGETEAEFAQLEGSHMPTWAGLMVPLERLEVRLERVLGVVMHLTSVKYSDVLQAAYDAVRPETVALHNRMSQSRAVYEGMCALRDGADWSGLSGAQQRIVDRRIRAMERSGVHLEGGARARYQAVRERLSELSNDFRTHLVKSERDSRIRVSDPGRIEGVPAPVLLTAEQTARDDGAAEASDGRGPWHFVVNAVNYMAVIQHAVDGTLREEFYRAYRSRGTETDLDNRPVLEEILALRRELAQLVGFDDYAEFSVDEKMASSVGAVWQLIEQLESAARPAAEREYAALKAYMAEAGADHAGSPRPWDVPFWSERWRETLYGYDSERLRDYFQLPRVLDGLFSLVGDLYGVTIRRVPAGAVPVWDPAVEFFEVMQGNGVIAGFYVDPYARPGEKRGGAWMNTVVDRCRVLAGAGASSSLPVALFVMNARPPSKGAVALMSLDEVRTLFHEFGHATQHMFTEIEEGGASGMNLVEWDAVELASQFNEYWMEHKPFLRDLTVHVETGEPLDEKTLDKVIASRNFMAGNATLRQLQFAKTDLALHERCGDPESPVSPAAVEREIARATVVTPMLDDESQLPAFSHIFAGGYAAGYYSYKWAEVLAADAFAAFREAGLNDADEIRKVARRFRDTVLGMGGSLPAAEVYRRFRGRDATPDALLTDQGLI